MPERHQWKRENSNSAGQQMNTGRDEGLNMAAQCKHENSNSAGQQMNTGKSEALGGSVQTKATYPAQTHLLKKQKKKNEISLTPIE